MKKLTVAQVKVGDFLTREKVPHLGLPAARHRVTEVITHGPRRFRLDGYWSKWPEDGKHLTAQHLNTVERDGKIIGQFFVRYW